MRSRAAAAALAGAVLIAGCTAGCTAVPDPVVPPPPPPPPPAACLLDTPMLAATTGLSWTPDASTASDTRCVYDPATAGALPAGPAFVAVEVAAAQGPDPAAELNGVAALCDEGSRADVTAGEGGFVCRFLGGSVFAAMVRRGQVVTLAASAVPPGTTAARLVVAFDQQLTALGS